MSVPNAVTLRPEPVKPRLRGWLHAVTFPAALAIGACLMVFAPTPGSRLALGVFAASASLLFGVSAVYHRGTWSPVVQARLRRLDHANIFVVIAGTYTPFAVLLLPVGSAATLLGLVWGGAALGVLLQVVWVSAPRWLFVPVYVALGWVAVFFTPQLWAAGGPGVLSAVVLGGVLYTAGGVVYGMKRPDPAPAWFGFHEVFHALTVLAFAAHCIGLLVAVNLPG